MTSNPKDLSDALLSGDHLSVAQVYWAAAEEADSQGNVDLACYLLTHAWVHALEAGSGFADDIRDRLAKAGRV